MQTDMDMHHQSAKDGPQVGQGQQIEEYDNMILLQYKSKLSPLMHNHGHHSSHLLISRQSSTNQLTQPDQLHYFKLGRERDRLKNYVQRQLDSEQTRTNQKILMRFQQEAALRRHHYLPKFVYETYEAENSRQKVDMRYQKAEMVPRINHQTVLPCNIIAYKSKFSSYIPGEYEIRREYRSPPLVATQKTKPPVYNYYNVLPHRNFDQYAPPNYNQHCKTVELPKKKTQVTTQKYLLKVAPQHSRAMSMQMQIDPAPVENNHVWALKKIKQAVIRKRQQRSKEREDTACSSGSSLVSRLERRRAQKMGECGQFTKHLRKLKKYRRIIAQQSKKRGEQ